MPSRHAWCPTRRARLIPLAVLLLSGCARGRAPVRVKLEPVPAVASVPAVVPVRVVPVTPEASLAAKSLIVPVEGVDPSRVRDSYSASRSGRTHDAVDIMARRGTPVLAADAGVIFKLRQNDAGGLTIYQLDPDERFIYYYAHLDRYRKDLAEGMTVQQGDVIGFVGTTGNAPKDTPHLHFQVMIYRGRGQYWGGDPINPHPYLNRTGRRQ